MGTLLEFEGGRLSSVLWTPVAEQDRRDIVEYIAIDNLQAAVSIDELLEGAVAQLSRFPHLGRPGRVPGTRELIPHKSYRIVYEIVDDTVWVLAVIHTSRQWPTVE